MPAYPSPTEPRLSLDILAVAIHDWSQLGRTRNVLLNAIPVSKPIPDRFLTRASPG
jgi:hypothetical protein